MNQNHEDHGRGDVENGPDDSDCICRGTPDQSACANEGCGFCSAAKAAEKRTAEQEVEALGGIPANATMGQIVGVE